MAMPPTIELLGSQHVTALPDFAAREEAVAAWSTHASAGDQRIMRVAGAVIGLCSPSIAAQAGASYARHGFDVLAFGGAVYGWLRGQGLEVGAIVAAARPLVDELAEALAPREAEVDAQAGFSAAQGEA